MSNVSAVMTEEGLAMTEGRCARLPKDKDEAFAEMLAVLLGTPNFTMEELTNLSLRTGQEFLDESQVEEKGNFFDLLTVQNSLQAGEEASYLNIATVGFKELTASQRVLQEQEQEQVLHLKELTEWVDGHKRQTPDVIKEGTVILSEPDEKKGVLPLDEVNLLHQRDFRKTDVQRSLKNLPKLDEITEIPEKTTKLNKVVVSQEEALPSIFTTEFSSEVEDNAHDLKLNVQYFSRDLPKMIMPKLKVFEGKNGSEDVIIHLQPKDLGKLIVRLTADEGTISVKFVAHYPVTRDLLESGLNSLRQSFVEQGISFDRLDVELGGQQSAHSQDHSQQQFNWAQEKKYGEKIDWQGSSYFEDTLLEVGQDGLLKKGAYDYVV